MVAPPRQSHGLYGTPARLGQIECQPCPSVRLAEDWRFEAEDLLGQALVFENVCVHMSAFANDLSHRGSRAPDVLPPSRRRRQRGGAAG
ncbi:MAG TPA: hypothetical protein VMZ31_04465 [Phycisphaerae bacterium]|nr:hypothetical protein [Phycisphaerae bacterium]